MTCLFYGGAFGALLGSLDTAHDLLTPIGEDAGVARDPGVARRWPGWADRCFDLHRCYLLHLDQHASDLFAWPTSRWIGGGGEGGSLGVLQRGKSLGAEIQPKKKK